jgi:hypothetical protein
MVRSLYRHDASGSRTGAKADGERACDKAGIHTPSPFTVTLKHGRESEQRHRSELDRWIAPSSVTPVDDRTELPGGPIGEEIPRVKIPVYERRWTRLSMKGLQPLQRLFDGDGILGVDLPGCKRLGQLAPHVHARAAPQLRPNGVGDPDSSPSGDLPAQIAVEILKSRRIIVGLANDFGRMRHPSILPRRYCPRIRCLNLSRNCRTFGSMTTLQ